ETLQIPEVCPTQPTTTVGFGPPIAATTGQGTFFPAGAGPLNVFLPGDFNGDGYTDFADVFDDSTLVSIDVHRALGHGTFRDLCAGPTCGSRESRWATQQGTYNVGLGQFLVADFDADGMLDIAYATSSDGTSAGKVAIDVYVNSGGSFFPPVRWLDMG